MSEIDQEKKTQFLPVIILMILAPTIAELLSGSSPTYLFFQPYYFIFSLRSIWMRCTNCSGAYC